MTDITARNNTAFMVPPFPHHPEPRTYKWSELERNAIQDYAHAYGDYCAAVAVAAQQAEIANLTRSRDYAIRSMKESTAYAIELRERLNKYEPGSVMHLNAPGAQSQDAQTRGTTGEWFDRAEGADALKSQAGRIKELEVERYTLRAQLMVTQVECDAAQENVSDLRTEIERQNAQLEQIAATEPVAWLYTAHDGSVQAFTNEPPQRLKELCKPVFNRAISPVRREPMSDGALIDAVANSIAEATRPMPAQDVTDVNAELSAARDSAFSEGLRAARLQDMNAQLVEALREAVDGMGGSYAIWSKKALNALSKYKGAK